MIGEIKAVRVNRREGDNGKRFKPCLSQSVAIKVQPCQPSVY